MLIIWYTSCQCPRQLIKQRTFWNSRRRSDRVQLGSWPILPWCQHEIIPEGSKLGFRDGKKRFCWIFLCLSLIEYSSSSFYSTQRSSEILFRAYTSYFFLILDFLCHSRCCQTSRHAWSIIPPKVAFGDSIGSCGQEDDESAEVAMNAWLARVPRLELDEHQCLGSLDACEGWRFDGISSTFSDPNHDPKPGSGFSLLHLLPEWSLEAHW